MKQKENLDRLRQMAGMVLELRAASLARAAADRDATREKIAALDCLPTADAMADMTEAQRFPVYEAWAAGRRALLNQQLARQQAVWCDELVAARQAFGRDQILIKLQKNNGLRR